MAEGILMPKQGITVESCTISKWVKKVGDSVKVGDILFEYETDKASFECESTAEGEILAIFFEDGADVPVLTPVCAVGKHGEDYSSVAPAGETPKAAQAPAVPEASKADAPAAVPAAPTGPQAEPVLMPKQGITVESCVISKWVKKVGDAVKVGDILFEYETDKASFECESTAEGQILAIFFEDGADVPVLTPVCAVGKPGDDYSALVPGGAAPAAAPEAPKAETVAAPVSAAAPAAPVSADGLKASPRAKNLAKTQNLDLRLATATGPYGRIIERDVRDMMATGIGATGAAFAAVAAGEVGAYEGTGIGGRVSVRDLTAAPAAVVAAAAAPAAPEAAYTDKKLSGIRKSIAKAMVTSLSTMAQLTNVTTFDATEIMAFRKKLKENGEALGLPNITLNDIILYAVSRVILNYENLNANLLNGDTLRTFSHVNLGVAVDTDRGLMVPTIYNADQKSLAEIASEAKSLAKAAQSGSINPDLLKGGSFTVTNLGSLGVESFTPVINPPQTGILGVGGIVTRVKEVNGELKAYPAMSLSVTYDHRVVDGAPAARFAKDLANALEHFSVLLAK